MMSKKVWIIVAAATLFPGWMAAEAVADEPTGEIIPTRRFDETGPSNMVVTGNTVGLSYDKAHPNCRGAGNGIGRRL